MSGLNGWGVFLIIFGVGSLILPFIGLQFQLFIIFELLFGEYYWVGSILCILAGVGILTLPLITQTDNRNKPAKKP